MNITAEKKRLQTKLSKVEAKIAKEEDKRDKAAYIVEKLTPIIDQLGEIEAMLLAQIALLDEHSSKAA